MSKMFKRPYAEPKERVWRTRIWRIINATIFRCVTNRMRMRLLRWFGAQIESWLVVYPSVKIYAPWKLIVKAPWAVLGPHVEVYNKDTVTLGMHAIISQGAYICTASHDVSSPVMALVTKPITIEDDCWVAAKAVVLPGVTLHEGVVVGCSAVVTKDVAPWTIVAGNPAKVVGKRELKLV